jgi:hypothetical protein
MAPLRRGRDPAARRTSGTTVVSPRRATNLGDDAAGAPSSAAGLESPPGSRGCEHGVGRAGVRRGVGPEVASTGLGGGGENRPPLVCPSLHIRVRGLVGAAGGAAPPPWHHPLPPCSQPCPTAGDPDN